MGGPSVRWNMISFPHSVRVGVSTEYTWIRPSAECIFTSTATPRPLHGTRSRFLLSGSHPTYCVRSMFAPLPLL